MKKVLLEFNGVKKIQSISDNPDIGKHTFVQRAFPNFKTSATETISLQRYDAEWDDVVDIELAEIKDRDKIKVNIIANIAGVARVNLGVSAQDGGKVSTNTDSANTDDGVNQLITNLENNKRALEYKHEIALVTLQSLKEAPRPRPAAGRNPHFTCSNCHFKGHRANNCFQPACRGYLECGVLALHREHREQMKQVFKK